MNEIWKDFNKLRHKFSKKEIDKYRKDFYNFKNYRYLSASKIKEGWAKCYQMKKSLRFKKFQAGIDAVNYDDLDNHDDNYDFAHDDEYRKIGSIKGFDRDYYKPKRTDDGFAGRNINYIEYMSRGDRYENFSREEYLDIIRSCLRDLINNHKPATLLTNRASNSDSERGEWKIQLVMQNNCISVKNFEGTRTMYSESKPVEIFIGSDTDDAIDWLFDTFLQRF